VFETFESAGFARRFSLVEESPAVCFLLRMGARIACQPGCASKLLLRPKAHQVCMLVILSAKGKGAACAAPFGFLLDFGYAVRKLFLLWLLEVA
jgi:hypothetical protein